MVRTQIQLPDDVYARARQVAADREISLAQLTRRGLEYILGVYSPPTIDRKAWRPPVPRRLGWKGLTNDQLRALAQ